LAFCTVAPSWYGCLSAWRVSISALFGCGRVCTPVKPSAPTEPTSWVIAASGDGLTMQRTALTWRPSVSTPGLPTGLAPGGAGMSGRDLLQRDRGQPHLAQRLAPPARRRRIELFAGRRVGGFRPALFASWLPQVQPLANAMAASAMPRAPELERRMDG
jgi:hypothetical protein